ncbi:nicotinamide-nucleotide amidohydrolase family protein [bacterium CPR1]|nr:nicotinamide-nucleotide amidohydrolase family protein [bacterium CPR1]
MPAQRLIERQQTVAVAESCTGGLLGAELTRQAGSSAYFKGGILAYCNELKASLLKVPREVLREHGAVSAECAAAMAEGARRQAGSDWALSVTGIAGPGGATLDKPVGLVYLGLAGPQETQTKRFLFQGDRDQIRQQSVQAALHLLREALQE